MKINASLVLVAFGAALDSSAQAYDTSSIQTYADLRNFLAQNLGKGDDKAVMAQASVAAHDNIIAKESPHMCWMNKNGLSVGDSTVFYEFNMVTFCNATTNRAHWLYEDKVAPYSSIALSGNTVVGRHADGSTVTLDLSNGKVISSTAVPGTSTQSGGGGGSSSAGEASLNGYKLSRTPQNAKQDYAFKHNLIMGSVWWCTFESTQPPEWDAGEDKPSKYGDSEEMGIIFNEGRVPQNFAQLSPDEKTEVLSSGAPGGIGAQLFARGNSARYRVIDIDFQATVGGWQYLEWKQEGDRVSLNTVPRVGIRFDVGGPVNMANGSFSGVFRTVPSGQKPMNAGNFSCNFHGYQAAN